MTFSVKVASLLLIASFTVFLAVKQFFILRNQVYQDAFYGFDEIK